MKALGYLLVEIKTAMIYRSNFILENLMLFVRLAFTLFFWDAVFQSNPTVGGYRFTEMLVYFFWIMILDAVSQSTVAYRISAEVTGGRMSNLLLKPVSYFRIIFISDIAVKISRFLFISVLIVLMFAASVLMKIDLLNALSFSPLFLIAMINGVIISFLLNYILGLLSFWTYMVWAILLIYRTLFNTLGGLLFPLSILPAQMFGMIKLLPFYHIVYFPMQFLKSTPSGSPELTDFIFQYAWIAILFIISRVLLKSGLKKYESVGQ
jgi:ABC-2 type transport system permease protein